MNRIIWMLLTVLNCIGCQPTPVAAPPKALAVPTIATRENVSQENQRVPAEPAMRAEKIFETLTANSWSGIPPRRPSFPLIDYGVSSFRADGTYSFDYFTDYHVPTKTGMWNLQSLQGQWFVCQDDGERRSIAINDDGSITLRFGKLYPHEPLARQSGQTAKTLPPLQLQPDVQEINRRLTGQSWKRANDLDIRMEPTLVRFRPDWTYVATYRSGECKSEGTWYATTREIIATSLQGRCDNRPGTGGDALTAKIIEDRRILVNGDLYVPENEPVPRGIIWRLSGFDQVDIRVEYDMPIRCGVPLRMDVTITNSGPDPQKLERFSLSRGYSDYGRNLGERGKPLMLPDDEISGRDLAGILLDPAQSHSFRLSAVLPDAGQQWVYFNSLVSGTTQNWDIHQARELTAQEPRVE